MPADLGIGMHPGEFGIGMGLSASFASTVTGPTCARLQLDIIQSYISIIMELWKADMLSMP